MWVILGNKVQTQRVPDGRKVERRCSACGETAMFYEREVSKSFRLYFVDLFNYETQRVMACGACGEHYATDELGRPLAGDDAGDDDKQKGTVLGTVRDALRRAGNAIQDATGVKADPDVADQDDEPAREQKRIAQAREPREPREDDFVDPLAGDDDELNARFADLEKKLARSRSSQKPIK